METGEAAMEEKKNAPMGEKRKYCRGGGGKEGGGEGGRRDVALESKSDTQKERQRR